MAILEELCNTGLLDYAVISIGLVSLPRGHVPGVAHISVTEKEGEGRLYRSVQRCCLCHLRTLK